MFHHQHCYYLGDVFCGAEKFATFVEKIRQKLIGFAIKNPFTHIAVSGVSGITVGSAVALVCRKNLIVVRKPIEYNTETMYENGRTHSCIKVEGIPIEPFNYIILDDLVSSGTTVRRITRNILEANKQSKRVGIFTYHQDYFCFYNRDDL